MTEGQEFIEQYYVVFNDEGGIDGFYVNTIHGDDIPEAAIPISTEDWQMYSADTSKYKLDGGVIRPKTEEELEAEQEARPPVTPSPIEVLQTENADLWYEIMLEKSRNDSHDSDISDIWYELMMGGAEA